MGKLVYPKVITRSLHFVGLYPLDRQKSQFFHFLYKIWQIFVFLTLFLPITAFIIEISTTKFDLIEQNALYLNFGVYVFVVLEYTIFFINLTKLGKFVGAIQTNFLYRSSYGFDDVSMEKTERFVGKLAKFWVFATCFSSTCLAAVPLLAGARILPLPAWKLNITESPSYEFVYFGQLWVQMNMGTTFGATDACYLCSTLLLAQQFKILRSNLKYALFDALIKSGLTRKRVDEFRQNLDGSSKKNARIELEQFPDVLRTVNSDAFKRHNYANLRKNIEHHRRLLEFVKDFDEIFRWLLLIKIGSVSYSMIFAIYAALVVSSTSDRFGVLTYVFDANIEMTLYTWPGQYLTESADLLDAIYECPWYLCDMPWKRSFLILQMKISQIVEIKAGGYFVMSLPSYVSFMKAVYSYVTVLRQVSTTEE